MDATSEPWPLDLTPYAVGVVVLAVLASGLTWPGGRGGGPGRRPSRCSSAAHRVPVITK